MRISWRFLRAFSACLSRPSDAFSGKYIRVSLVPDVARGAKRCAPASSGRQVRVEAVQSLPLDLGGRERYAGGLSEETRCCTGGMSCRFRCATRESSPWGYFSRCIYNSPEATGGPVRRPEGSWPRSGRIDGCAIWPAIDLGCPAHAAAIAAGSVARTCTLPRVPAVSAVRDLLRYQV